MTQQIIRVTKIFTFEAAHALEAYDGPCRNIHGHSYKLFVTVRGPVIQNRGKPKDGMVVDFKDLKALVEKYVISVFDHSLILNSKTSIHILSDDEGKIINLPFQPSSENIIAYIVEMLKRNIPAPLSLYSLKLAETESSFVEWFEEENSFDTALR